MSEKMLKVFEKYPADALFVGIDIAKHKHCARAVGGSCKSGSEAIFFDNNKDGLDLFLSRVSDWQKMHGASKVVMGLEPTGNYGMPAEHYLKKKGFDVFRVSALNVSRMKDARDNSPLKSDKKDSLLIAQLLREGNVLTPSRQDSDRETVKVAILGLEDLEHIAGLIINHAESYCACYFPELPTIMSELVSPTTRALLKKYSTPAAIAAAGVDAVAEVLSEASRMKNGRKKAEELCDIAGKSIGVPVNNEAANLALKALFELYEVVADTRKKYMNILRKTLRKIPQYRILISIKGVGLMTAASIIAFLGDLKDYNNAEQVLKKAGLNLFNRSSGTKYGNCHISRRGKGLLRRNLYMACMMHTRANSPFHERYDELHKRLRSHRKAMVALMRKTLRICFALVRDGEMFDPCYEATAKARREAQAKARAEKNQIVIWCSKAA